MTFGQSRYAEYNELLNAKFAEKKVLICAHRGSWNGNVTQNTTIAYKTALMRGADILETDTIASADGKVLCMHDGVERRLFGNYNANRFAEKGEVPSVLEMTAEQIQSYMPANAFGEPSRHRVQFLSDILEFLSHGELINVDRTWKAKGLVLSVLDSYPYMRRQAILKAPFRYPEVIDQLENHPVRYMFMPVCHSLADVEKALELKDLNMVGIELVARFPEDELFQNETIDYIHSKGLMCWVNALNLTDISPAAALYGGLDDDTSILEGPDAGWGKLIDKGIDVIQTDFPDLLREYRAVKLGTR